MVAPSSFLRWCEEERSLTVLRFRLLREREGRGRERWLLADEIAALERVVPREWWRLLRHAPRHRTPRRRGAGGRWQNVRLAERRVVVREHAGRRLKSASSERAVPITEPLARILAEHAERVPSGPNGRIFPGPLGDWRRAYHRFRTARRAGLHGVTVHDLRHTFGVHCAQAPLPRLQKLMGHASAVMTMRYMKHAPESYFAEDAARVAASLTGERDRERSARPSLVRETRKPVADRRQQNRARTSDYKIDYSGISGRAAQSGRT
jgi:integrase